MISTDHQLKRLLKGAAQAPRPLPKAGGAVQAAALLAWRTGAQADADDDAEDLLPFLRRALIWACLAAVGALAFGSGSIERDPLGAEQAAWIRAPEAWNSLP